MATTAMNMLRGGATRPASSGRAATVNDWQQAFDENKHKIGRAVHEAWAAEKIRQGFADHVWVEKPIYRREPRVGTYLYKTVCARCDLPEVKHHRDMLDYDDLALRIQEYDIQTGIVGFRMGYEAALAAERARAERAELRAADLERSRQDWIDLAERRLSAFEHENQERKAAVQRAEAAEAREARLREALLTYVDRYGRTSDGGWRPSFQGLRAALAGTPEGEL